MTRERWMATFFAAGSACFLVGPFPGYVQLVGATADAVTFFVGSILFTLGGALQTWLALRHRHDAAGRAALWAAAIQSAGTLFFNVSTFQALHTAFSNPDYNRLVWRPDAHPGGEGGHTLKHGGSIFPNTMRWLWGRTDDRSSP